MRAQGVGAARDAYVRNFACRGNVRVRNACALCFVHVTVSGRVCVGVTFERWSWL